MIVKVIMFCLLLVNPTRSLKKVKTYNLYKAKNLNQEKYEKYLEDEKVKMVIATGPAGTGKTMIGCLKGLKMLKSEEVKKIIITRPIVAVEEEELGFLPGNIVKKMDPWTRPIMDIFMENYSKSEIDNMINSNIIEISPLAYMRGRTFKDALIIADEMQNSTPNQMLMLTTRIGKGSKLVITGDLNQADKKMENNGLKDIIEKIKKYKNVNGELEIIKMIEFEKGDIERSELVEKVIDIYKNVNGKELNGDAALIPLKDYPMSL